MIFAIKNKSEIMKICDIKNSRNNNFDFLRFSAALLVTNQFFVLSGSKFEPLVWISGYDTIGGLIANNE